VSPKYDRLYIQPISMTSGTLKYFLKTDKRIYKTPQHTLKMSQRYFVKSKNATFNSKSSSSDNAAGLRRKSLET